MLNRQRPMTMAVIILLCMAGSAAGDWLQTGSSINNNSIMSAQEPALAESNGTTTTVYITWRENTGLNYEVLAKQYDGVGFWQPLSTPLNVCPTAKAINPDMGVHDQTPMLCWTEFTPNGKVWAKEYNGMTWDLAGTMLNFNGNQNAISPRLTIDGLTPVVAWIEETGPAYQVYIRRWNFSIWDPVISNINMDVNRNAAAVDIAAYMGTQYVAWQEDTPLGQHIFVRQSTGGPWNLAGGFLNINANQDATNPRISLESTQAYVTWEEFNGSNREIFVKRFNGTDWELEGGGSLNLDPNQDAFSPDIDVWGGEPYVAWCESDGNTVQVYVKRYTAGAWTLLDGSLNVSPASGASAPDIHVIDNTPYVAWAEGNALSDYHIYCKRWRWETPTITPTMMATVTATQTPVATPIGTTPTATFTPTVTWTPTPREEEEPEDTPTLTPTLRAVQPGANNPIVIRGNVLKPSTNRPMEIGLYLDRAQRVKIKVYTLRGRLVTTLVDRMVNAGSFETAWNGANRDRVVVRSGVYIIFIETEQFKEKRKMVVIR